ncbi:hypothetical protein KI387_025058, partial [Taxus chinensis]
MSYVGRRKDGRVASEEPFGSVLRKRNMTFSGGSPQAASPTACEYPYVVLSVSTVHSFDDFVVSSCHDLSHVLTESWTAVQKCWFLTVSVWALYSVSRKAEAWTTVPKYGFRLLAISCPLLSFGDRDVKQIEEGTETSWRVMEDGSIDQLASAVTVWLYSQINSASNPTTSHDPDRIGNQGMTILTLSAFIPKLKPSFCRDGNDECHSSKVQISVCFFALYLIALGTGGIKPCVSSFGADQFDEMDEDEKEKKSSFFNWFYFSINIGALVSSSVLVWVQQNVGWGWGFGIPTVTMGISICSFLLGTNLYRHKKPGGSALTRIAQVVVASTRKWKIQVPLDKSLLYEVQGKESTIEGRRNLDHTDKFLFLDKAAIQTEDEKRVVGSISPWHLTTVTQVEELKSIIYILPIWASGVIFAAVFCQMGTLFIEQGDTMNLHVDPNFKIPSASLTIFDTISVLLWVPVYDRFIVPFACKYTGHKRGFTHLQRIGIGLMISTVGMIVAAIVEILRLRFIKHHNFYEKDHIPMSIFWQVPQYFILGAAEVFTNIGNLEFFYDQAPDGMRSLCSALTLTTSALGCYLSTLLVTVVTNITRRNGEVGWIPANLNHGHIDDFFWLLAFLSFLNFLVYLVIAHWYKYKKPAGTCPA